MMIFKATTGLTLATLAVLGVVAPRPASAAVTILNPSFEGNVFNGFPGYVDNNGNGLILDWVSNNYNSGANGSSGGLNPLQSGDSPFANNGTIPDGNQVAFLQTSSYDTDTALTTLSQTLTGFTSGDEYVVSFYDNSRAYQDNPVLTVSLGGQTIVMPQVITPVGGSNPYNFITSAASTATGPSADLVFSSVSQHGGDDTALIDDVSIRDVSPAPEPSQVGMLALLGLGLGGLMLRAKRRHSAV